MEENNRRKFLKEFGFTMASASLLLAEAPAVFAALKPFGKPDQGFRDDFVGTADRIWIGEKYWSIPMEDWQVKGGRIECNSDVPNSRVNLLTTVLQKGNGEFNVVTELGLLDNDKGSDKAGTAGFNLGVKDEIDPDVKAACYYGKGLRAGISLQEGLFIGEKSSRFPKVLTLQILNCR